MKRYLVLVIILAAMTACKQKNENKKVFAYNNSSLIIPELPPPIEQTPTPTLLASNESMSTLPAAQEITLPVAKEVTLTSKPTATYDANNPNELDFEVENKTNKTLFVTCFVYQRKRAFGHWRWDKSPVYALESGKTKTIDIDTIPDEQDRLNVFGYLGVFNTEEEANNAVYELTPDQNILDLDLVYKLKGKKVTLEIEKYGYKEIFDYDFVRKDREKKSSPELDFTVLNKTGKPILVTCFVYEKKAKGRWVPTLEEKDDMTVWRFDKTPLIKIMPEETGIIDVDTIHTSYDRSYIRGYLAVFDVDEEEFAKNITYELLPSKYKLNIGKPLIRLTNKTVVIEVEKYGVAEDFIDFIIKPRHSIDFTKIK